MTCFVNDPAYFGGQLGEVAAARMPRALRPEVERSHRATFAPGEPLTFGPDQLATITVPALVVHGADDRLVSVVAGECFAAHLPAARLEIFEETGHWLQLEQPQRFADMLRSFMKEARP